MDELQSVADEVYQWGVWELLDLAPLNARKLMFSCEQYVDNILKIHSLLRPINVRVHTELGKPGKSLIFRKSQGKPGKVREFVAIFIRIVRKNYVENPSIIKRPRINRFCV